MKPIIEEDFKKLAYYQTKEQLRKSVSKYKKIILMKSLRPDLRYNLLRVLDYLLDQSVSPIGVYVKGRKQVASDLKLSISTVYNHFNRLLMLGMIEEYKLEDVNSTKRPTYIYVVIPKDLNTVLKGKRKKH
ncbi:hypothetical protein CEQ21_13805 [Niallia circulans]|uniref:Uncharacterized protein n=1 Tax=Niallia circulans TaxID=1397 RepID=A0A553SHY4_NIACI|nr:hypothetical protein [Niallia circulans]TRZ36591.1 hypothetical protein CEQ21_13805 [Niallia circulans]